MVRFTKWFRFSLALPVVLAALVALGTPQKAQAWGFRRGGCGTGGFAAEGFGVSQFSGGGGGFGQSLGGFAGGLLIQPQLSFRLQPFFLGGGFGGGGFGGGGFGGFGAASSFGAGGFGVGGFSRGGGFGVPMGRVRFRGRVRGGFGF